MKTIIIVAVALLAGQVNSSPVVTKTHIEKAITITQDRTAIKPEDLPDAVKATLGGEAYSGWEVTGAYVITKEDKTQYFEVILKKAEETATINLDKDGRKVE